MKVYAIKDLFGILVTANVNVILVSVQILKSCDFSECLDYKNCKCRKNSVDKLVDEYTKTIEETSLVKTNSTKYKHNSCILYIVLFSIFFIINFGIDAYFFYFKYMNHNKKMFLNILFVMFICLLYFICLSNNNLINKLIKWEK